MLWLVLTISLVTHADPVAEWLAREHSRPVIEGHASTIDLVYDAENRPVKTPYSALVISGLYNSPQHMEAIARRFHERGLNVINLRLAAHWEVDSFALRKTVRWTDWKQQAEEAFVLAQQLGEKVILIGHSTGALLNVWNAVEHPENVAGLALFAPAFKVRTLAILGSHVSKWFELAIPHFKELLGIDPYAASGRVVSGHAGLEVKAMSEAFRRYLAAEARSGQKAYTYAAERLQHIPVWMANTKLDVVISRKEAVRFYQELLTTDETPGPRQLYTVSRCSLLLHDHLVSPARSEFLSLMDSLDRVLPPR